MSTANASIIVKLDINTIQNMIHARCITLTIILVVLAVLANLASTVTAAITPVALVALAVLANTVTVAITPADLAAASPVVNTLESRDNIEQTRRLPFMDNFRTKPFKWWRQDARQGMQARVNDVGWVMHIHVLYIILFGGYNNTLFTGKQFLKPVHSNRARCTKQCTLSPFY
jgi:hypothetical protein